MIEECKCFFEKQNFIQKEVIERLFTSTHIHRIRPNLSEAVHFHFGLGADAFVHKEFGDVLALVTLQLNHLPKLRVVNDGPVAAKIFLECLENSLEAQFRRESLDCRQCLATIALLDSDMDKVLLCSSVVNIGLGKGIEGL
jgi:hypothetical protein